MVLHVPTGRPTRGYGSCEPPGRQSGSHYGSSTTPTQLLETTPLVTSCTSEHSSASPISGDLPSRTHAGGMLTSESLNQLTRVDTGESSATLTQDALMAEIKRLRERLIVLETENTAMSIKLSQQQWEVEHRLAEIEMQICGASSGGSSTEDNERNQTLLKIRNRSGSYAAMGVSSAAATMLNCAAKYAHRNGPLRYIQLNDKLQSSPMASLVLTDSSQLTVDSFKKLPDQIVYPYAEPDDLQKHDEDVLRGRRNRKDTTKKCFSSFKQFLTSAFVNYCKVTSLHGLGYITSKDRHWIERLLWTFLSALSLAIAGILIQLVWVRFQKSPTVISIEDTNYPIWKVPFPGVTLCNSNKVYKPAAQQFIKDMMAYGISNVTSINFLKKLPWLLDPQPLEMNELTIIQDKLTEVGMDMERLMLQLMQPCDRMVVKCDWEGYNTNCSDIFDVIKSLQGYCCSFNYHGARDETKLKGALLNSIGHRNKRDILFCNIRVQDGGEDDKVLYIGGAGRGTGLSVILDVEAESYMAPLFPYYGISVLIHDGTDYPEISLLTSLVQPRQELSISVGGNYIESEDNVRGLNVEQRLCWFDDEIPGNYTDDYSYQTCVTGCRITAVAEKCGCLPFYYPTSGVFSSLQPPKDTPEFGNSSLGMNCNCLPQCTDKWYSFTSYSGQITPDLFQNSPFLQEEMPQDVGIINIFFKDFSSTKYRRYCFMTWDALFATFGGIFGLCLGGSVISLVELVYHFTIKLWVETHNSANIVRLYPQKIAKLPRPKRHSPVISLKHCLKKKDDRHSKDFMPSYFM
uniref:Sodium channel protein Nach n=1 Tax=Timema cristinae TaxID=61476 RepID=A0A7R9H094_TIMCR|nr:unnamed protein product [Timema cristinae]